MLTGGGECLVAPPPLPLPLLPIPLVSEPSRRAHGGGGLSSFFLNASTLLTFLFFSPFPFLSLCGESATSSDGIVPQALF